MDNAYSELKAFRHPEVLVSIKAGIPVRVPHVQLVLADLCNQLQPEPQMHEDFV